MSELKGMDISIDPTEMESGKKGTGRESQTTGLSGLTIDTTSFMKEPKPHNRVETLKEPEFTELSPLPEVTAPLVSNEQMMVPVIQKGTPLGSGVVVDLIGQGGMTKVYRIWNEELEMHRAVKLVNQVFSGDTSDRFRTEAKICAKFDHPNIIHIHNVGKWYDIPFIEMEYIEGHTLDYYIKKFGRIPAAAAGAIALKLAEALHHVHSANFTLYGNEYSGIIHRDLKPSNIMIGNDGTVKLMDFGIARPVETGFHTAVDLNVVGTIQYFSPEQLDNNSIDHTTDIYALGAILYEMLSGTKTFPYTTLTSLVKMKTINSYKDLNTFDFTVQKELKAIASKSLRTERNERYKTAEELRSVLEAAFGKLSSTAPQKLISSYVSDPHSLEAEEARLSEQLEDELEESEGKKINMNLIIAVIVVLITIIAALFVVLQ